MLDFIEVQPSPGRGRGVFTKQPIDAGTVIEKSPFLILSEEEGNLLRQTVVSAYLFYHYLPDRKLIYVLAFGYVSIYNHSYTPSVILKADYTEKTITIQANRDILPGEELFINYNGIADSTEKVYFNKGEYFAV